VSFTYDLDKTAYLANHSGKAISFILSQIEFRDTEYRAGYSENFQSWTFIFNLCPHGRVTVYNNRRP